MKKLSWVSTVLVVVLAALCVSMWQHSAAEENVQKALCKSSVKEALAYFEAYAASGNESDYTAGVAEFRAYMMLYLCLTEEADPSDYDQCRTLYNAMLFAPAQVKAHLTELLAALRPLAEDDRHPDGFRLIHVLNDQLGGSIFPASHAPSQS